MKKIILLLAVSSFAINAGAQERNSSIVFNRANADVATPKSAQKANFNIFGNTENNLSGARTTTTGGGRWYDYCDSVLALNSSSVASVAATELNIWNDTTAVCGYMNSGTPTYFINKWTSVGLSFNPMYTSFNDSTVFPKRIKVTSTNAYIIDSVEILGSYLRPLIAGTYKDSMRLSLVYGNGTSTSDLPGYYFTGMAGSYGIDTVRFFDLLHDSLHNEAGVTTAPGSVKSFSFPLSATDTATNFDKKYAVNITVPAGNVAAISISFKSMDPTISYGSFDTVQYADGTCKHGDFLPLIAFAADATGTTAAWAPYDVNDHNVGFFKREGSGDAGWGGNYIPTWAWSASTGGASGLQFPVVLFHVTCATCGYTSKLGVENVNNNITNINAYPNPAADELNISFDLTNRSDASVSLINVLGQTVATKNMVNVNNGVAVFNTSALPDGMYIYSVENNGVRSAGHVVIAH